MALQLTIDAISTLFPLPDMLHVVRTSVCLFPKSIISISICLLSTSDATWQNTKLYAGICDLIQHPIHARLILALILALPQSRLQSNKNAEK